MEPVFDVLVLGSGAAGLATVLRLLELAPHLSIAVVTKDSAFGGSTALAQGGIAAALDSKDSLDSHIADTETAGAGLCHRDTVRFVVERAPAAIAWLAQQGVTFDRCESDLAYALTLEGGHTHRRIVHAGDATGHAIACSLLRRLNHHRIACLERCVVIDLIVDSASSEKNRHCRGAVILNEATGAINHLRARVTVLATGGASGAYLHSTNPVGATGDGIAMAWRAGCRVANLEFNQFHPTCFYQPSGSSFLISEALRGEGGCLRQIGGTPFMRDYDPRGELAPRDIVAAAIDDVMKRRSEPHVVLIISHLPAIFIRNRFPTIAAHCRIAGVDITRQPIPVVPAAHYTCGGVVTDLAGRSDLDCLYVLGEAAWTGLHGANRLASNSLLEFVVFGLTAAEDIVEQPIPITSELPLGVATKYENSPRQETVEARDAAKVANWRTDLRRCLWENVGIVRCPGRLMLARDEVDDMRSQVEAVFAAAGPRRDIIELRNLALVADLIIRSALQRRESRGLHFWAQEPPPSGDRVGDTILCA